MDSTLSCVQIFRLQNAKTVFENRPSKMVSPAIHTSAPFAIGFRAIWDLRTTSHNCAGTGHPLNKGRRSAQSR